MKSNTSLSIQSASSLSALDKVASGIQSYQDVTPKNKDRYMKEIIAKRAELTAPGQKTRQRNRLLREKERKLGIAHKVP